MEATEPTTPRLTESEVEKIEARLSFGDDDPLGLDRWLDHARADECALIRDWRAMRAENERLSIGLANLYHVITDEQCPRNVALGMATSAVSSLKSENAALRQWKAEALPLLTRYDNLAETFGGKLGSSKVTNLERGVAALREQLAEAHTWIDRKNAAIESWQQQANQLQSQLAQVTSERDAALIRVKELNDDADVKKGYL